MSTIKMLGFVVSMAFAGVLVGCGLAWWAAHQWTTFNDYWLFAACVLPIFGAIFGARLGTPKENWPPGIVRRTAIALTAATFSGIGSYVAFAIVALTWNGSLGGVGDFFSTLLDPSRIPELSTRRSGGASTTSGVVLHAVISLIAAAVMTFLWLRKSKSAKD